MVVSSRLARVVVVFAAAALAAPAAAGAHLRSGTVAVDDSARITSPGGGSAYAVRVYRSDRALDLVVRKGHSVVVVGYLGEPFLRVDSAGVAVNEASPTAVSARLIARTPGSSGSRIEWRLRGGRGSVVWHDARVQTPPAGMRHAFWSVPVVVDGRRSSIRGEVRRLPPPPLWPWLLVLGLVAVGAAVVLRSRRRELVRVGACALAVVAGGAAVATVAGFAFAAYASPGTWIAGVDETILIAACAGVMWWGPPRARVAGAGGIGLLALAVGLSKGPVFLHPIVLSLLPAVAARLAACVSIAAGLVAAVFGGAFYALAPRRVGSTSPLWQDLGR